MVDVLEVIEEAYRLYKEKWGSVIVAFAVIFLIGLVFGLANFILNIFSEICKGVQSNILLVLLCISPTIFQMVLSAIDGLLNIVVMMAVIKPLDEMASGKPISYWMDHFVPQLFNGIVIMSLRILVMVVCLVPAFIILFSDVAVLDTLKSNSSSLNTVIGGGGLLVFVILIILGVVAMAVINFLLMFLEVEAVLRGGGIINEVRNSVNIVKNNLGDALIYSVIWWLIGIAVSILTVMLMCTLCLAPVAFVIQPFVVEPVSLLSKVMLWRRFGGISSKDSAG